MIGYIFSDKTTTGRPQAIKGFVVMSQELDEMYLAFLNNQLPQIWKKVSYASLKPLASWYKDLIARVKMMKTWLENENPTSFWLSGFFFPQGNALTTREESLPRQAQAPIVRFDIRPYALLYGLPLYSPSADTFTSARYASPSPASFYLRLTPSPNSCY